MRRTPGEPPTVEGEQRQQPGCAEEPAAEDIGRPVGADVQAREAGGDDQQGRDDQHDRRDGARPARPCLPSEVGDQPQGGAGQHGRAAREAVVARLARLEHPDQLARSRSVQHPQAVVQPRLIPGQKVEVPLVPTVEYWKETIPISTVVEPHVPAFIAGDHQAKHHATAVVTNR